MAKRSIPTVGVNKAKLIRQETPRLRAAVANMVRYGQDEKEILDFVKTTIGEVQAKIKHEQEAKEKAEEALKNAKRSPRRRE